MKSRLYLVCWRKWSPSRCLKIERMILCTHMWVQRRLWQMIVEWQKSFFTKHDGISCCIKTWKMLVVFIHTWAKIKRIIVKMTLKELLPDIHHNYPTGWGTGAELTSCHSTVMMHQSLSNHMESFAAEVVSLKDRRHWSS